MPALFAIIASQRSGTQVLREVLNSNPRIAVIAEPFSLDDRPSTWHSYLRTLPAQQVPPATSEDASRLLDEFERFVRRDLPINPNDYGGMKQSPTCIGLDIKYNQIKHASPLYVDLRARPFLLDYFRDREVRIIHLLRRNVLHVAISIVIANLRQVWHNYDGSPLTGRYRISLDELFAYAQWAQDERTEFERLAIDLDILHCDYDELARDLCDLRAGNSLRKDAKVFSELSDFLQVSNQFRYNRYIQKVINRPYSDVVENYDEVVAAVRDSALAPFAESI